MPRGGGRGEGALDFRQAAQCDGDLEQRTVWRRAGQGEGLKGVPQCGGFALVQHSALGAAGIGNGGDSACERGGVAHEAGEYSGFRVGDDLEGFDFPWLGSDAGNEGGGFLDGGAGNPEGAAGLGGGEDFEGKFREDAEAAEGSAEEFREIESRGILDDLASAADGLA